ncbi:RNA polymerase sigma factor [Nigerium massiliense]|uniref:RNA polymerase sigma factor n=1 Tax=Nigerium massiliense TaxID=1522317 RepID=UPI000694E1AB|nr:sigma-70 family RNA polymerase sigma factor [Nigerium massiliense]
MSTYSTEPAFGAMFEATSARVYAYARRHADADTAPDVVAEVYLIAWKRRDKVPDEPVPWLIVTARNVLHRHWRTRSRQQRLATELAGIEALATASSADGDDRQALVTAFSRLSEADRETLLLVGWDGLTPQQAAGVVGCSPNTFAARLSRARRRLTDQTEGRATTLRAAPLPQGDSL